MMRYDSIRYEKEVCELGLDNLPDIVTVKQLAEFLQISEQTVIRALKSNDLRGFKVGREWRIEKESIMLWVKK